MIESAEQLNIGVWATLDYFLRKVGAKLTICQHNKHFDAYTTNWRTALESDAFSVSLSHKIGTRLKSEVDRNTPVRKYNVFTFTAE
jgi:hypothetical protein